VKIVDVQSTIVPILRRQSLTTVYGEIPDTLTVVVQVYTDEGITGIGQTLAHGPWYGDSVESIKVNIDKYLAPAVNGQDPFDIERLFAVMVKSLGGATNYPITAVENALWDLKGKALGVPVYQLLGGRCQEGAPLHSFVPRRSIEESAEVVTSAASEGWTWFKGKIGFDVDEDIAWYSGLREAVGNGVRFQMDGNTGYTLGDAIHSLTRLEQVGGVALFEQPVRYLDEMAILASRLTTPLQADEALTGPRSVHEIVVNRAAHVLHFKIEKYGGLLAAKRMAAIAEAAGLELSVAAYFDIAGAAAAHFAASTPNATWPAGASDMLDTILTEPYGPTGQVLAPPEGPGFGVKLDEDKLATYRAQQD
jgi:L-alanine-DL-glutamate epimerase-like enolase superfamily enzyme